MLLTTTSTLEGHPVRQYLGLVSGEAILGANVFRDFFAGIRDIIGGRSGSYEKVLRKAKEAALEDMAEAAKDLGANAVVVKDVPANATVVGIPPAQVITIRHNSPSDGPRSGEN